jgi:hypothetical protein
MNGRQTRRDVSAREAIECIRGSMTNGEVMERFKISLAGYADLLKQLFVRRLITEEDLNRRGIRVRAVTTQSAEEPPEQVPVPIKPAGHEDEYEEFLDTLTLTELLTFKPKFAPEEDEEPAGHKGAAPVEDNPAESDKKGGFTASGLHRKER